MKYRLIAVDMDGTLLNGNKEVTPRTRSAMLAAAERGAAVTLCSGRPMQGLESYLYLVSGDVPVVTYNGGVVLTARGRKVLFSRTLEPAAAVEIARRGLSRGAAVIVWAGERLYVSELSGRTEAYGRLSGSEGLLFGEASLEGIAEKGIVKIIWMDSPERTEEHLACAESEPVRGSRAVVSAPPLLEFMDASVSKAEGLRIAAGYCGVSREEIMAVGDNYNDLDMLLYAGLGVAMGNAPEAVRRSAAFVTLSNEEDGVAEAIERFILA